MMKFSPGFRTSIATVPGNFAFTSTLIITGVQKATDEGEFSCSADNIAGGRKQLDQPYNVIIDRGTNMIFLTCRIVLFITFS